MIAGNLWDVSSFGHVSFMVGSFPDFLVQLSLFDSFKCWCHWTFSFCFPSVKLTFQKKWRCFRQILPTVSYFVGRLLVLEHYPGHWSQTENVREAIQAVPGFFGPAATLRRKAQ